MKSSKALYFILLLSMIFPLLVFANSGPVSMSGDTVFSLVPMGDTPISVVKEYLEFDMTENSKDAKVKASYQMKNNSDSPLEQMMVFPFINSYDNNFINSVGIRAAGESIEFEVLRLDNLSSLNDGRGLNPENYDSEKWSEDLDMETIIEMINQREYKPNNYSLDQPVKVYTLHLPVKDEMYDAQVSFKINPQKHKILKCNISGYSYNTEGNGKLSAWSSPKGSYSLPSKAYIAVMGQDIDQAAIESITGENITVEEKTIGEFLRDCTNIYKETEPETNNGEELNSYIIRNLDKRLQNNEVAYSINDITSAFFSGEYLGVLIYKVNFEAQESLNVEVEYQMNAAIDRRRSVGFTNSYLYMLQPAAGWKSFEDLTIKVIPNSNSPYIIESSLPLTKDEETGIYSGQFAELPNKDLYFTTYRKPKRESRFERTVHKLPLILYWIEAIFWPFILAIIIIVLLVVVFVVRRVNKRNIRF